MLVGDVQTWVDSFVSFDDRFLERIAAAWPECLAVLAGQPREDDITINLVDSLAKDAVVRRLCHWVEYQFEPFGLAADGSKYSKGIIDIAVLFDWDRERYLAYECKRLNVIKDGTRRSLATEYVTQGMMRFMTEQYAEHLPIGCMIGYVLDANVSFARSRLNTIIGGHSPLSLIEGPTPLSMLNTVERFRTLHKRVAGSNIELRHALFSYSSALHLAP
ncbi:hypothetical protein [Rhizobium leguminosarum]|uniref:hypothetical protein n=1 Tax=Rhizobium leguminosarum TaxID=384 RepID=UPI001441A636|nr:hypothetical protein [Rhizobium leguminosarum]MBY2950941.1 hypothetical protein [Rhizobium leguminosarum]NKL66270.1 hypothetical protein [Rhizobium leguminosarum bv. viciae]